MDLLTQASKVFAFSGFIGTLRRSFSGFYSIFFL